ncbi:hypothetical protein [Streptomyces sp. NBC_00564]|uniref:hypothetical protein n=1 Tax=Streptomyces sp. NBC_00564 TaxID=2903663 RepID=UPI00352E4C2F|nr:hypothetical protein OG256_18975 [Streptomyces sp. NBC_00564]
MRTKASTAALCLFMGAVTVGCAGDGGTTDTRSADQLLGEAYRTMNALTSVTIGLDVTSGGDRYSGRLTTDLKSRCALKATSSHGSEMEQIRIGETDYIHPNDVYLDMWGRKTVPAMRNSPWLKSPVSAAKGADDLVDCAWPFSSFGEATKADPTELDGKPVIPVKVTDDELKGGVYTFYVAAEGKPYLLRIDYKDPRSHRVTKFSDFNNPVDIQPPAAADVLDLSSLPPDES